MNTGDDLHRGESHRMVVDHLVANAHPVHPLWPVRFRLALWLALSLAMLFVSALMTHPADLIAPFHQRAFGHPRLLAFAAAGFLASLALRAAVPGRDPYGAEHVAACVLVVFVAASWIWAPREIPPGTSADGVRCLLTTLAVAIVPWCTLWYAVERGAPGRPLLASADTGSAAFLVAATVTQNTCPFSNGTHALFWHLGVVPIGIVVSLLAGLWWMRQPRVLS